MDREAALYATCLAPGLRMTCPQPLILLTRPSDIDREDDTEKPGIAK